MTPLTRAHIVCWPLAAAMCCASTAARAQSATDADREALALAQQGLALRGRGQDAEALAAFERSLAIAPRASVRAQLGFAQQALGRWVEAEQTLNAVRAIDDPWVQRHRATIDEALRTIGEHLGTLSLTVEPADAIARVDGAILNTGTAIRIPVGAVRVRVEREGYFEVERLVTITAGQSAGETVTLRARPAPIASPPRREPPPRPQWIAPPALIERPWTSHWSGPATTLTVGTLSVGASGILWALRGSALGSLRAMGCVETAVEFVCDPARTDPAGAMAEHQRAADSTHAAIATALVGGALIGAGVGWLVYALQWRRSTQSALRWEGGRWVF